MCFQGGVHDGDDVLEEMTGDIPGGEEIMMEWGQHAGTETEHEMDFATVGDIVIGEGLLVFELAAIKDEALDGRRRLGLVGIRDQHLKTLDGSIGGTMDCKRISHQCLHTDSTHSVFDGGVTGDDGNGHGIRFGFGFLHHLLELAGGHYHGLADDLAQGDVGDKKGWYHIPLGLVDDRLLLIRETVRDRDHGIYHDFAGDPAIKAGLDMSRKNRLHENQSVFKNKNRYRKKISSSCLSS